MKLSLKFAATLLLGIFLVFAVASVLRVQREIALFRLDIARDQAVVSEDLAAAMSSIWEIGGEDAALGFIDRANQSKGHLMIRWVPTEAVSDSAERPDLEAVEVGGRRVQRDADRLRTAVPVIVGGERRGALELSESLADERAYVRETVLRTAITTGIIFVVSGAAALLLGVVLVGRPVRQLVEKARRIADGDFSGRLELRRNDELATLACEMNLMSDQLEEAQRRVAEEAEGRLRALEQLRHAERLKTLGQIASGIAHEMGTPLNIVQARAKMIVSRETIGDEAVHSAQVMFDQTERMISTIRRFLSYARRSPARRTITDLRELVGDAVALLQPIWSRRQINVRVTEPAAALRSRINPEQMRQVLTNLLLNSMQAMPQGGHIDITLERTEDPDGMEGVRIDIVDDGGGIAKEHLECVFDPFFSTKGADGTGLGLSISREIMREHEGTIVIDSTPGLGTKASIELPGKAGQCAAGS